MSTGVNRPNQGAKACLSLALYVTYGIARLRSCLAGNGLFGVDANSAVAACRVQQAQAT